MDLAGLVVVYKRFSFQRQQLYLTKIQDALQCVAQPDAALHDCILILTPIIQAFYQTLQSSASLDVYSNTAYQGNPVNSMWLTEHHCNMSFRGTRNGTKVHMLQTIQTRMANLVFTDADKSGPAYDKHVGKSF